MHVTFSRDKKFIVRILILLLDIYWIMLIQCYNDMDGTGEYQSVSTCGVIFPCIHLSVIQGIESYILYLIIYSPVLRLILNCIHHITG